LMGDGLFETQGLDLLAAKRSGSALAV